MPRRILSRMDDHEIVFAAAKGPQYADEPKRAQGGFRVLSRFLPGPAEISLGWNREREETIASDLENTKRAQQRTRPRL